MFLEQVSGIPPLFDYTVLLANSIKLSASKLVSWLDINRPRPTKKAHYRTHTEKVHGEGPTKRPTEVAHGKGP